MNIKKVLSSILAASLFAATSAAFAQCGTAGNERAMRVKTSTIGAINQETFQKVESLLKSSTLAELRASNSPELHQLHDEHLVQPIEGGRVVCAEINSGFFQYAKRVRLDREGFSVWVHERDLAIIN